MKDERELDEMEARLIEARQSTPPASLPADWKDGVMGEVRARAGEAPEAPLWSSNERAVRIGAMAAAALALLSLLFSAGIGATSTGELYALMRATPESFLELFLVF